MTGEYVLTRDPSRIRVIDIFEALEGPLALADCVRDSGVCERAGGCVTRGIWLELSRAIEMVLSGTTLGDLVLRHQEAKDQLPPMYHI